MIKKRTLKKKIIKLYAALLPAIGMISFRKKKAGKPLKGVAMAD